MAVCTVDGAHNVVGSDTHVKVVWYGMVWYHTISRK